ALGDRRFSLIVDQAGIYYDATQPSDIENLLNHPDWLTPELESRSASLLEQICKYRISKYNHEPVGSGKWEVGSGKRVLVVDQTSGDCSVEYGQADKSSFKSMLDAALAENPDSDVWVKVHPDVVLGKKKGYFKLDASGHKVVGYDDKRLNVLADKVNAQSLFPHFDKVYVVTSQLGFEALWHRKEVVCFGVPFYSGWGLTDDRVPCPRRKQTHTIESLFAAACLKYTRYICPESGARCELEDIVELIACQRRHQQQVNTLYAVGFSLWKRAFITHFIGGSAGAVRFVSSLTKAVRLANTGDGILLWGTKEPDFIPLDGVVLWRAEDAFIRSNGLGAELRRPGSLVLDKQSMYYDCTKTTDLEDAINSVELTEDQIQKGEHLRKLLYEQRVSKYNLVGKSRQIFADASSSQKKILVTGQVENDASLKWGSPEVFTNLELLKRVRNSTPDAYIVYKPHPDVLLADRPGHVSEAEALKWADKVVTDCDIIDCIDQCDELHVMTSLSGFEALTRGKKVHCWGLPFYAGWGVTVDHIPSPRRVTNRTLNELIYLAHYHYPRYINWHTRHFSTPERTIRSLKAQQQIKLTSHSRVIQWLARTRRKAGYLLEAMAK
ncbi:MAG: capsular polysaccharide biosynthesis protein, partial [Endozoicomonas sp.]